MQYRWETSSQLSRCITFPSSLWNCWQHGTPAYGRARQRQSAFIKGRCLHDNFLLVRQVAKRMHPRECPGALLKRDISRAFDSLSWAFLFEVLQQKGFSLRWRRWIVILLYSSSSEVRCARKENHPCPRLTAGRPNLSSPICYRHGFSLCVGHDRISIRCLFFAAGNHTSLVPLNFCRRYRSLCDD